jgi:hypothetical protein
MEKEHITPIGQVCFTWDKAYNDAQIVALEDDLYTIFRGRTLRARLAFRRHPKTHIDAILLNIYQKKNDGFEYKICEFSCPPGELIAIDDVISAIRADLPPYPDMD